MKKPLAMLLSLLVILSVIAVPTASADTVYSPSNAKAWSQKSDPWASDYYGAGNIYDTGCGIVSAANALNYLTGKLDTAAKAEAFIDEWAAYAYSSSIRGFNISSGDLGSYGTVLYNTYDWNTGGYTRSAPPFVLKFGATYQFDMPMYYTSKSVDSTLANYLQQGCVAIANVPGHYIAIVDYDPSKGYLVLDSYTYYTRGGQDIFWASQSDLNGGVAALKVSDYCILRSTKPTEYPYEKDETTLMLYDGEKADPISGAYNTKVTVADGLNGNALQMACNNPDGNQNQIGGQATVTFTKAADLQNYRYVSFNLKEANTSSADTTALSGNHTMQIDFMNGKKVAYRGEKDMSNLSGDWHILTFTKEKLQKVSDSADWSNITSVKLTWVNTAGVSASKTLLIDNLKATNGTGGNAVYGIDVSRFQGDIDFEKVKAEGVEFVILRIVINYGVDSNFETYYKAAKAAGLEVGGYVYMYGETDAEVQKDLDALFGAIEGKTFEYPIWMDIEESFYANQYTGAENNAILKKYLDPVQAAGYYTGIYTYNNFANNSLDMSAMTDYDTWIAHYTAGNCGYTGAYGMWQHSSTGLVNGISGNVDINWSYKDYGSIMKRVGLNGYEKGYVDPESTAVEKLIADLPALSGATTANQQAITAALEAYNQLTVSQKALVSEEAQTKLQELAAADLPDQPQEPDPQPEPATPGDLNGDHTVDAKDALAALKHAVGKPYLSEALVELGDLNGDGTLDAKDALAMLKIAVAN